MTYSITDMTDFLGLDVQPVAPVPPVIPATMTESEIAAFLGLATSSVRTKTRDGILVRSGRARFDVAESLRRYLDQLRSQAARAGRPVADDLKEEKLRLATAQAVSMELKNAVSRGEMVKAVVVEREWVGILRDVRSTLLAVPSRVGAKLPHLTPHDVAELGVEIKSALEALANGH